MEEKFKLLRAALGEERVKKNEELKYHVFSKLSAKAHYFYIATTQAELINVLEIAWQLRIPFIVFGAGTKLLINKQSTQCLMVKNRTGHIKIGGIKGKVNKLGLGIEEALIEVDSGLSLGKVNEFLKAQNLKEIVGLSSVHATVGGAVFLDPSLFSLVQKIKIWQDGEIEEINYSQLKKVNQVVLSVVLKIKGD